MLARLGAEGKLVLEVNRGAFVPSPSVEDIREIYRARPDVMAIVHNHTSVANSATNFAR